MRALRMPNGVAVEDAAVTPPMRVPPSLLTGLRFLVAGLSILMVVTFLLAFRKRVHFAFEYDWIEDGVVASVRQIRLGLPLYSRPSVEYTPFLYTPLYPYVCALASRLFGISYVPLRMVSFAATLGCFGSIYGLVYSEARRHMAAIAAVGCFAACYPLVNNWFDIGRVDMLALFFLLSALWATRRSHPVFAALLWVCAFQTKQGVLPIALLALCYDWHRPKRVFSGVAAFVVMLGGSILWLTHTSHGWYRFYVFSLGKALGWSTTLFTHFWTSDVLLPLGLALIAIVAALVFVPLRWRNTATNFYALNSLSILLFTWFIRAHLGSNVNALLPVYAWIAVLLGVSLGRAERAFASHETAVGRSLLIVLWLGVAFQLAEHIYGPRVQVPGPDVVSQRKAFEEQIRSIPGDVLLVNFPERGHLAGKPLHASGEATGLVIDTWGTEGQQLVQAYHDKFVHHAYSAVVLDRAAEKFLPFPHAVIEPDFTTLYPLRVFATPQQPTLSSLPALQPVFIYLSCSQAATAKKLNPAIDLTVCSGS